jgi:hypothetical protein
LKAKCSSDQCLYVDFKLFTTLGASPSCWYSDVKTTVSTRRYSSEAFGLPRMSQTVWIISALGERQAPIVAIAEMNDPPVSYLFAALKKSCDCRKVTSQSRIHDCHQAAGRSKCLLIPRQHANNIDMSLNRCSSQGLLLVYSTRKQPESRI